MTELTKEFLAESEEGLDRMDQCLTELEMRPDDAELLAEIFRSVHTIKGTTGFLGFARLEKLAHAGESLLGPLREGRLRPTPAVISGLLRLMDGLRAILRLIEASGDEGEDLRADRALIALLKNLDEEAVPRSAGPDGAEHCVATGLTPQLRSISPLRVGSVADRQEKPAGAGCGPMVTPVAGAIGGISEKTLRINVEVLNRMMNLVGDLVLTRNQILQSQVELAGFAELTRRLDGVTADLRETVMQARMQPVSQVFGRFPRMVRDLALSCGKQVRLEFRGEETGLDKSLLEAIKDPLTHLVRNAVDHGIEDPRQRLQAGKPAQGVLSLRAHHHNGSVVIEVADDGRGIDVGRVVARAVRDGLIAPERAAEMSAREALQLVFRPGLSTAEDVTHVSGRGIGMDVVLANIERIGGKVELESQEGQGTLLRMRVPLTLAIVRALVVRSGGQSFCLPERALEEFIYVPWRDAGASMERMGDAELYRLRDQWLPLVRLDRMLGMEGVAGARQEHGFYVAVLEADGCPFGLVIDDLMSAEEIVVKPLAPVLREIGLFSGATVLGSGSLAMILDVPAIGARAGACVNPEVPQETRPIAVEAHIAGSSFLVFDVRRSDQPAARMAMPLRGVERIESVPLRDVQYASGRPLLQYGGELLPLQDVGGVLEDLLRSLNQPEAKQQVQTDVTATVLICRDLGPGIAEWTEARPGMRAGVVVREVIEVADGLLLDQDVQVYGDRVAMVNQRLTVMHSGFAADMRLQEVA